MMPRMRRSLRLFAPALAFLLACSFPGSAAAQPAPPPPAKPAPAQPDTRVGELPAAPNVDDPMLQPVARPRVEVATWEVALSHLRARSTDLRIAGEEIA